MVTYLILEFGGTIREITSKDTSGINSKTLDPLANVKGKGELEIVAKINYYDSFIVLYGWPNGDSPALLNLHLNKTFLPITNKKYYGDIFCFILDKNDNILDLDKKIYYVQLKNFFDKKINNSNNLTDDESDYESNINPSQNKNVDKNTESIKEFNLSEHLLSHFI